MLYEFNYLMFGGAAKNPEEREQLLLKEAFFHTPGEPRSARFQTSDVEMVRDLAVAGWTGRGLPDSMAIRHRTLVESHLVQYTSPNEGEVCDQLYVLEFQGPHLQYLKFGITADLITRVNVHCEEGHRNGLALLNGWASPQVTSGRDVEKLMLRAANMFPHTARYGERFYGMRFETGKRVSQAVCDEAWMAGLVPNLPH